MSPSAGDFRNFLGKAPLSPIAWSYIFPSLQRAR